MQVGDLVISTRPWLSNLGVGIVVNTNTMEKGGYALAVFGTYGQHPVYPDAVRIINASR